MPTLGWDIVKTLPLKNSTLVVLVDDEDYPVLSRMTWYVNDSGYAATASLCHNHPITMHKLVLGTTPHSKACVDHKNRERLDNQKANLHFVTRSKNSLNSKPWRGRDIPYKGVYRTSSGKPFTARCKDEYLGRFLSMEEAARAYDKAASRILGSPCYLNFPFEHDESAGYNVQGGGR